MKKVLATLLFTSTLATAAVSSEHAFDGFKVGLESGIGISGGKSELVTSNDVPFTFKIKSDKSNRGFIGGGHLGYDKVFTNRLVLGIETFVDFYTLHGKLNDPNHLNDLTRSFKSKAEWSVGVMGRIGYAFDQALVYFGAGWIGTESKIN